MKKAVIFGFIVAGGPLRLIRGRINRGSPATLAIEANMTIKILLILAALAVLPCTPASALSIGYPDDAYINLQYFRHAQQLHPVNTNDTVSSWVGVCDVLREKRYKSRSDAQVMRLRRLNKIISLGRIFVLPVLLLFILVHTRSPIRSTRPDAWVLLVVLIVVWILSSTSYIWDTGLIYPTIGVSVSVLIIASRDYVRVGPCVTWLGMLLMALLLFCPIADWIVPKGHQYLDDYDFPRYSPQNASTNLIVICEKLDLRPHRSHKAALFVDGRLALLERRTSYTSSESKE